MSTASTTTSRGGRGKPARPASRPAAGPPPGGSSRTKLTGRLVSTSSPTTTTSGTSASAPRTCSSMVTPAISIEALSAPWKRTALPPVSTMAPSSAASPPSTPAVWHLPNPGAEPLGDGPHGWQGGDMADQPADKLNVRLVQRASGLDPVENRAVLDELAPLAEGTDLVVLPEAFARDFGEPGSDLAPYAEPLDGPFATRLRELSTGTGTAWLAGMFEVADDPARPLNTLVLADDGELTAYRKIHLYDSFGHRESSIISAGAISPCRVDLAGFPLGLMTCYDLRFPELARALVDRGAEALVMPAAWVAGERKVEHWRTLLRARAIENTAWVIGVGQPGPRYTGHSIVVAPDGDVVVEADEDATVLDAVLDRDAVATVRRTNPSVANRRM